MGVWKIHDDVISAIDDFFDQWDPNTEIPTRMRDYVEKLASFGHIP